MSEFQRKDGKTCATCEFWAPMRAEIGPTAGQLSDNADCRRYAPREWQYTTAHVWPQTWKYTTAHVWPQTWKYQWCGEWKEADK